MKKLLNILILAFVLTSCQNEKKLNGTWISSYKFSDNDSIKDYVVGGFPFNQLITFDNGTFNFKEFKYDNYENERTSEFELTGQSLVNFGDEYFVIAGNEYYDSEIIDPLTKDSIVFKNYNQNRVYKRLVDSLKNKSPEIKFTGKKIIRNFRKWTDTIQFINDSVYISNSWKFGDSNHFMWERINHNGFDILFTENYAPFILKKQIGNEIYISIFGNKKEDYILKEIK
ncbi:hypothetical protein [Olleya sp. HaHaR_3_96]|uniref:hypothetical protein n=1 Tax=Olleya sp. HaHaR_3_96 TaxID=2745560 RepID=UPI001C501A9C|nr:hypothetical protein [Olleya sp. HaHaR_3_96]QXP60918.1 hypothetical protein H0I26_04575 [Olleya sp. HaHaR_3_96]